MFWNCGLSFKNFCEYGHEIFHIFCMTLFGTTLPLNLVFISSLIMILSAQGFGNQNIFHDPELKVEMKKDLVQSCRWLFQTGCANVGKDQLQMKHFTAFIMNCLKNYSSGINYVPHPKKIESTSFLAPMVQVFCYICDWKGRFNGQLSIRMGAIYLFQNFGRCKCTHSAATP